MARSSFTRDEVILTLDTLYFSGDSDISPKSNTIFLLSELLNSLPIYTKHNRPASFRTPKGISGQLSGFKRSIQTGIKDPNVGKAFFDVEFEYENDREKLHQLADDIRNNLPYISNDYLFGDASEYAGFPEGIILGHLHRVIEVRDSKGFPKKSNCCICQIDLSKIYSCHEIYAEYHLMVPPANIYAKNRYNKEENFLCVCSNCHSALHKYRPWITSDQITKILQ